MAETYRVERPRDTLVSAGAPPPRPAQHQRRPPLDHAGAGEMEAAVAVGREHAGHVALDQAGEDQHSVIGHHGGERGGEPLERAGQDVGEHHVEAAGPVGQGVAHARRGVEAHVGPEPVEPGIAAGGRHRLRIEVSGHHRRVQRLGGGKAQDTRARADIEDPRRAPLLQFGHQGPQAAERGAVVAGAEGERRLDLDGEVVGPDLIPVVAAMDEEASGADRLQPLQRGAHPVLLVDGLEGGLVRLRADHRADQVADHLRVGLLREVGFQPPRAGLLHLEGGDRRLHGIEHLAQKLGHGASGGLVRDQAQDVRGSVRRQTFEHEPPSTTLPSPGPRTSRAPAPHLQGGSGACHQKHRQGETCLIHRHNV
jgi:hypothetical protein